MADAKTSRYETVERGITRVHSQQCGRLEGARCRCTPTYRGKVHDKITGRDAYKSDPSIALVRAWRRDKAAALAHGTTRNLKGERLRDAWPLWLEQAQAGLIRNKDGGVYRPSVLKLYEQKMRDYVLPALGGAKLDELDVSMVHGRLVATMQLAGHSASNIRNAVNPLRAFYTWAVFNKRASVSPCDKLRLPKGGEARERIAAPEEAMALIESLPRPEDRAWWATAFLAGLRRGEILALRVEDLDLTGAEAMLSVRQSFDERVRADEEVQGIIGRPPNGRGVFVLPKTKKGKREVGVPKVLAKILAEHLLRTGRREGLVFGPDGLQPMVYRTLLQRAYCAFGNAGLEKITPHECRHTYASLMIAAGVNIKVVSEWMGHSSVNVTLDIYGHLMPGAEREALGLLNARLAAAGVV